MARRQQGFAKRVFCESYSSTKIRFMSQDEIHEERKEERDCVKLELGFIDNNLGMRIQWDVFYLSKV